MKQRLIKLTEAEKKAHPLYGISFGVYFILALGWFGLIKILGDMRVSLIEVETGVIDAYFTKGSPLFLIGLVFLIYFMVVVGMSLFALSKSASFVNFSVIGIVLMWIANLLLIAKLTTGLPGAITHPLVIFQSVVSVVLIAYILSSEKISVTYLGLATKKCNA